MKNISIFRSYPKFHFILALSVISLVALASDNVVAVASDGANTVNFAADCNFLAGSPNEPENLGTGRGVELADLEVLNAIFYCREARKIDPETPSPIYRIGRAYHARGYESSDWRTAWDYYTEAEKEVVRFV